MRVVVGLGNPGVAYARTRHNVGFLTVEELARRWNVRFSDAGGYARSAWAQFDATPVRLVEPMQYMNLSGQALARLAPVPTPAEMIVVHDDIDLESGCIRVKRGGGTAGHRGLESIVAHFGERFTRVRIGVGRPARGGDAASFVLSAVESAEHETMTAAVGRAADAVECILRVGEQQAMNVFNRRIVSADVAATAPSGRE
jgi:PTH1 family peptidyl-tRNA hydrolase